MGACYGDVLKRLKEERNRLHWSQDDICRYIHINQGNYCKIEQGNRRFGYYEIKELYRSDFDVNYIFSGQRCKIRYEEMIGDCSYREALALFSAIASVVTYCWERERTDFWKSMYQKVKFIRLIDIERIEQQNLFLLVRQSLKYLQPQMAELLEVDIKNFAIWKKVSVYLTVNSCGSCMTDFVSLRLLF